MKYKYKYRGFRFDIYRDWIFPFPSMEIHTEDMCYIPPKMISIALHFLVFHARWLWRYEPYREDGDTE